MGGRSRPECAFDSQAQTFCPWRSSKRSCRTASSKAGSRWSELNGQEWRGREKRERRRRRGVMGEYGEAGGQTFLSASIREPKGDMEAGKTGGIKRGGAKVGVESRPLTTQPSSRHVCCPASHTTSSCLLFICSSSADVLCCSSIITFCCLIVI